MNKLHDDVKQAIDPQGRGRQYVASQLEKHTGTRVGGFVLERQAPVGKWGAATYVLKIPNTNEEHGGHRGHGGVAEESTAIESVGPDAPYAPYANGERGSTAANTITPLRP